MTRPARCSYPLLRRSFCKASLSALYTAVIGAGSIRSANAYIIDTGTVSPPDGDNLIQALSATPFVSEGTGQPVYVFMSQNCAICRGLWDEHKQQKLSVEFRWLAMPYAADDTNEVAEVYSTKSLDDFDLYMSHSLSAPDINQDNNEINTYNGALNAIQAESSLLPPGTPLFIWQRNGIVKWFGGYESGELPSLMRRFQV